MRPRERVLTALEHREPDRVPLDGWFGFAWMDSLKKHFDVVDDVSVNKKLGIDFRYVTMRGSEEYRERSDQLKIGNMEWFDVIPLSGGLYHDEFGVKYRVGATGDFYHIVEHPMQYLESIDEYEFPDINAPGRFEEADKSVKIYGDEFATNGIISSVLFTYAWFLRGYRTFIRDLYGNPGFVNKLLDKLLAFRIEQVKRLVELGIDIIGFADDIGVQKGMMINPTIWRNFFKPRMEKLIREAKKRGQVYVFYHSDGNIESVIPDLIEIGVDILNPIQPECMNPAEIKIRYGKKLTLHGTISLQETLPFGTVDDVRREVIERIKTCGYGGGFVLAPANMITPDISMKNILAVYETAQKYLI